KHRSEVVLSEAWTHSLKIDEIGLAVAHQNILRLEIAMDQYPRTLRQILSDFLQGRQCRDVVDAGFIDSETTAEAILEKVVLLPTIERGVKFRRQMPMHLDANVFRQSMKFSNFVQSRFVKRPSNQ